MITFDEFHAHEIEVELKRWMREKADPEHYTGTHYNQTEEEYIAYLNKWCGSERLYWDRQSHWFVTFDNGRVVKVPKRKYSEDDKDFFARIDKVITKVERESTTDYGKFACMMQKTVKQNLDNCGYLVYPTTYGIGLWAIYNWHFDQQAAQIESLLNKMGVEYNTEYSDAAWVFRYKISKKEANRILIEKSVA